MAENIGYALILETVEEFEALVRAFEKARQRDKRQIEETVKTALHIV